ncbi:hypothetical protein HDU84_002276 [Entophlyctis sp. JEL0112]|nr:hypothetical protein HDU84_002276 [Entophlyctis sp. JEL0112]
MDFNFVADADTTVPMQPFDDDAMFVSLDRPTIENNQTMRMSRWSSVSDDKGRAAPPSPANSYAPVDACLNLALARSTADSARFGLKPLPLLSNSDVASSSAAPVSPPVSPVPLSAALSRAASAKSRSDSLSTTHEHIPPRVHFRIQSPEPLATASVKRQLSDGLGKLRTKLFDKSSAATPTISHTQRLKNAQSDSSLSSVSLSELSENDIREFVELENQLLLRQRNNSVGTTSISAYSSTSPADGYFVERVVRPSTSQSFSSNLHTQARNNEFHHPMQQTLTRPNTSLDIRRPSASGIPAASTKFPREISSQGNCTRPATSLDVQRRPSNADARPSFDDYVRTFSLDQCRPLPRLDSDDSRSIRSGVRARFQVSAAHASRVGARKWPNDWLRKLGVVTKR